MFFEEERDEKGEACISGNLFMKAEAGLLILFCVAALNFELATLSI